MSERAVEVERLGGVAWLWLNRPAVHNAFDAALIAELTETLRALGQAEDVRVVVLAGRGRSFSAGADVQWMQQQGAASLEENKADAQVLAELFQTLSALPKPTVARVHGAALGGGVGLVCACDVAIGASAAAFGTTEVRLGLIPATIAPYVLRAIGERQARWLFQTGERIDAATALRIGLLHIVVEAEQLDEQVRQTVNALLAGGPKAQREAKELIAAVGGRPIEVRLIEDTADRIAKRRADDEAREGLRAFVEKQPAAWARQP